MCDLTCLSRSPTRKEEKAEKPEEKEKELTPEEKEKLRKDKLKKAGCRHLTCAQTF